MCIHDRDTKRTAGTRRVVAETTLAELRQLDVGSWKDERFAGERIATLSEVLTLVPDGKRFFIEIKCGPEAIDPLAKALAAARRTRPGINAQLTIISFNAAVVKGCREKFPHITCNWLVSFDRKRKRGPWEPSEESVLASLHANRATGIGTEAESAVIDADFVRRLRDAGLQFHCWTIDDPGLSRRFAELGADSITTNVPAAIRRALDED